MIDLEKDRYRFADLVAILDVLRGEGGCPWDREQTHASIRRDFLEETYEACDAIDRQDDPALREELGDVLLQVVFHAAIARDAGAFTLDDVTDGICRKLLYRHPHVFGGDKLDTADAVLDAWDVLKRREKSQHTTGQAMDQVAASLPALIYAEKIQKKARKVGFDWPDVSGALDKVTEETHELRQAIETGGDVADELGDLLFAAVNVARFLKVDAEEALKGASRKFARRFAAMEAEAGDLSGLSLAQMDKLWDAVKGRETPQQTL